MPAPTGPSPRGPGVPFPPPLVFVAGWLIASLLDRRLEFLIVGNGPGSLQIGLGYAAMTLGLSVMLWGISTFLIARTAIYPASRARAFVITGPYRLSRNPMYVGLTQAYVGLALVLNRAWPLVLLPPVLLALRVFVIGREERYLLAEFGKAYEEYRRRVRRWI
jgi:protein-S-isoprenylcysteine O-methyltransferase Ste14